MSISPGVFTDRTLSNSENDRTNFASGSNDFSWSMHCGVMPISSRPILPLVRPFSFMAVTSASTESLYASLSNSCFCMRSVASSVADGSTSIWKYP